MGRQPSNGHCLPCMKRRVKRGIPCPPSERPCDRHDISVRAHSLSVSPERDLSTVIPRRLQSAPPDFNLPPELPLVAFRREMATTYFFRSYVWAPFWRSLLLSSTSTPSTASDGFNYINQACFDALMYSYMGRAHRNAAFQDRGRRLYTRVLGQVQKMLPRLEKPQLAQMATPVIVMGMYEFAIQGLVGGTDPHHLGIHWILQHCGPEGFQDPELLQIFRSCRGMMTCQALWLKTRCYLEAEAWKTVPWQHTPKTFEDRIMDIFVDLPGLAQDVDSDSPETQKTARESISVLMGKLKTWRGEWDACHWHDVYSVPPLASHDERDGKSLTFGDNAFSGRLKFNSPTRALEILYYNACLLYLTQLSDLVRSQTATYDPHNEPFPLRSYSIARTRPALEGLVALSSISDLLNTSDEKETVIPPAPMAILYWVLQDLPELIGSWEVFLSKSKPFEKAQEEFEGFKVKFPTLQSVF
ncbi:hypothetical protein B0T16DRAFT_349842 [Cercophora newfieldiana]|uniref:Uncharacterized protein n=1 Tax=Cercophora newfieldiana TaxID=92897 RepID=A0AA39YDX8_9PEZI|nr:hypothetical protein B0T16DRAFT_349842 [Cercophora newfieldiana]